MVNFRTYRGIENRVNDSLVDKDESVPCDSGREIKESTCHGGACHESKYAVRSTRREQVRSTTEYGVRSTTQEQVRSKQYAAPEQQLRNAESSSNLLHLISATYPLLRREPGPTPGSRVLQVNLTNIISLLWLWAQ